MFLPAITPRSRAAILLFVLGLSAAADEGLWLFNQFPKDAVKEKYAFDATDAFLHHLQLSTVRIPGGTGSFVSPTGLLVTNQHLIAACSPNVKENFYAPSQPAEKPCSGLTASVLTQIEDVTPKVKTAANEANAKTSPAQVLTQRNAAIAAIEKECGTCSVVKLFSGGRYDLYHYKKFTDIRLVFAPEDALAFFGRERDSITYLRYGLDVAFLRVYENGKPAATPNFLKWSMDPVREGDFVVAAGNPAPTTRSVTAAQLTFYRDSVLPLLLRRLGPSIQQLSTFAGKNADNQRLAQPSLTALLETYKSSAGKLIGLRDDRLVLRKTLFDKKIRNAVERDPKLGTEAGKVWDQIAAAYKLWAPFEKQYEILEGMPAPGSQYYRIARQTVRGEAAEPLAPTSDSIEILLLTSYLEELKTLGDKIVPLKSILGGKTPAQAAESYVTTPKGMITLATILEDPSRKIGKKHDEVVGSLEASAAEKIAGYRFRLFGAADYPDATSTPRVEFGVVKSYTDRAGVAAPFAATFSGLYYRRLNEGPYMVPQKWVDAKAKFDPTTSLDFVSTCDVGGGDAGNPTVNRAGDLVGILFDGNLESLPNTYLYTDEKARAVHVATQGIAEALDKVYKAAALLQELIGPASSSSSPS